MIPQALKDSPPRNIQYTDDLFKTNRSKVRNFFVGAPILIPLMALIWWLKFDEVMAGIYIGIGFAALVAMMGVGFMVNSKNALKICQHGIVAMGIVEKCKIHGNKGRYTSEDSSGYILVTVNYKDKASVNYKGMISFIGASGEIDMKEGDETPVVYKEEKPQTFISWSDNLGISTIGKAKLK